MTSLFKKTMLTAVFGAASLTIGCSKPVQKPAPPPDDRAEVAAQVRAEAAQLAAAQGQKIVDHGTCSIATPEEMKRGGANGCVVALEKNIDDGLVRWVTFRQHATTFTLFGCNYASNSSAADRQMQSVRTVFNDDAEKKFAKMGLSVVDTFAEPSLLLNEKHGACVQQTSADFLLKSEATGNLYQGTFTENFDFGSRSTNSRAVTNFAGVDRASRPGR